MLQIAILCLQMVMLTEGSICRQTLIDPNILFSILVVALFHWI